MKIYWKDRNGNTPPLNATFHCIPFFPDLPPLPISDYSIVRDLPAPSKPIQVKDKKFYPEETHWYSFVSQTTEAIENGYFEKAVLARCCVFECAEEIDPFAITASLQKKAEGATVFCFSNEKMAFLGATPEFLFSKNKNSIWSEAVAGTTRRGQNSEDDEKLAKQLLSNPKTLREIRPVQTFLCEKLSSVCWEPPNISNVYVKKTVNVQHLSSDINSQLKEGITDRDILDQIHPTPALCGMPRENAFAWIREREPFDRRWYGSAIGWSTEETSQWAAAIRCCYIEGKTVFLYTGVGIVAGSDPKEEWEELNDKMNLYQGIFL